VEWVDIKKQNKKRIFANQIIGNPSANPPLSQ